VEEPRSVQPALHLAHQRATALGNTFSQSLEKRWMEKGSLVICEITCCQKDIEFALQLAGKSKAGKSAVKVLLNKPCTRFAPSIKTVTWSDMPEKVVDSSKSVVGPSELAAQQWVLTLGVGDYRGHLEGARRSGGPDHFIVGCIRMGTPREDHLNRGGIRETRQHHKNTIRLRGQRKVGRGHSGVPRVALGGKKVLSDPRACRIRCLAERYRHSPQMKRSRSTASPDNRIE
jgi:hypothetical protein